MLKAFLHFGNGLLDAGVDSMVLCKVLLKKGEVLDGMVLETDVLNLGIGEAIAAVADEVVRPFGVICGPGISVIVLQLLHTLCVGLVSFLQVPRVSLVSFPYGGE